MKHADVVRGEVVRLKVHEHKGKHCFFLYGEGLVQLVEEGLEGQHDVHRLSVEEVVQVLLGQHNLNSVLVRLGQEELDL